MRYRVVFDIAARDDLDELYAYIRERAGPQTAHGYVMRLREFCRGFERFPERGTRRDETGQDCGPSASSARQPSPSL